MHLHHLKLNLSKSDLLFFPSSDLSISVPLESITLSPSSSAKNLKVTLDSCLFYSQHISTLAHTCRFFLSNIQRIRPFLTNYATLLLVQALNSIPEDLDGSGGDDEDFSGSGDGERSPDVTMSPSSSSAREQASTTVEEEVISPVTATSPEMAEKTTTSEKPETTEGSVHILVADTTTSVPVSTVEASPDTTTAGVASPGVVGDKKLSSTAVSPTLSSFFDVSTTVPLTSASIVESDAKPESTADSATLVGITQSSSSSTSASVHIVDLDAKPEDPAGPSTTVGTTSASTISDSAGIIDSDKPESTADSTTPVSTTHFSSSSTFASVHVVDLDAKPEDPADPSTTVGTTSASTTSASAGIADFVAKPDGTAAFNITDGIAGPNKGRKLPVDTEDLATETYLDDMYLEDIAVSQDKNKVQAEVPQITQSNNHQEAPKLGDNAMSQGFLERKEVLGGVIAGGIIGLAFAVLLVVLMVYRMKKKDEGSYALDDQKHSNGGYQKPQKQEEFLA
ncbi:Syndecan-1 [Acipenser ruthenus]|uniref:Syndecan n=1 Tax=Acipenser ruthenus TaxID=7906 RepID=A0A444TYG5_ACIRT|nr:Syndecan-1 [Acipenser ruthenus]